MRPARSSGPAGSARPVSAWLLRARRRWPRIAVVTVLLAAPALLTYGRLADGRHGPADALVMTGLGLVALTISTTAATGTWRFRRPTPSASDTGQTVRRAAVVYNPLKVPDLAGMTARVESFMARAGWAQPLWLETTLDDPGLGMCQRAVRDECDVVFVCGGDGTVMAAVSALAGCGLPLAILPAGTGNLLARNLDLPLADEEEALRIGTSGRTLAIDVGAVDNRKFAVMAGMGFDAAIMRDAPERLKRAVGWPAYLVSGAKHLRGRRIRVTVTVDDGEPMHRRVRTVLVGNVGRLQGNIPLMPDAVFDDGLLDVVLIAPRTMTDWARVAGRVVRRAHVPDRRMERYRGRHVRIESSRPQPRQLDGDVIEDGAALDIQVQPRALLVKVR